MARELKVGFVALGCAKNLVDSERMLAQLAEGGCLVGADLPQADVIVVNTCGFLEAAREEAHEAIREAVELKDSGRCRRVVVAGCLVQRDGERLLAEVPGVDALVGAHNRDDLLRAVQGGGTKARKSGPAPDLFLGRYHPQSWSDRARLRLTPRHYAYVRINEGCDQKCTFCTIPSIRGPMHSKSPEEIVAEARELIADGAVELNLIGQDTTSYGKDIGYEPGLAGLLRELNELEGVSWLRLLYAYPSVFKDEMIAAISECEKVVKYVDVPLQHVNDRVLRAMGRGITRVQTEALLDRLRERVPGIALRTTLIAGFPGETEAEFAELMEFVREQRFEALGVFAYSHEPETPAGRMDDQLDRQVKAARVEALMRAQWTICLERNRERVGTSFDVLVESETPDEEGYVAGRAVFQAPQVDSVTRLQRQRGLRAGQIVPARCTGWQEYDLLARPASVMLPVVDES
ncbi:MAG: 30S ribosomal protein S12 methylthiotransferase RimO [Phycisphaerales bacterium]|nr:MAG: 30S ribosomal protein S12 methylthiotransferase RimO [Phycisphaerales bacterium]